MLLFQGQTIQGLHLILEYNWIQDIQDATSVCVFTEYLDIWDMLSGTVLQPGEDTHCWRLSASRQYSAKSAYENFFQGSVQFQRWERIWKPWVPGKCHLLLWLVVHKRCWTMYQLALQSLPHPVCCPHCDQVDGTSDHQLTNCAFVRHFGFNLLRGFGLRGLSLSVEDRSFDYGPANGPVQKYLNFLSLEPWTLEASESPCF